MLSGREGAADAHSVPDAPAGSSRTAPCHTHTHGGLLTVLQDPSPRIRKFLGLPDPNLDQCWGSVTFWCL
jgi:hypothetical protein